MMMNELTTKETEEENVICNHCEEISSGKPTDMFRPTMLTCNDCEKLICIFCSDAEFEARRRGEDFDDCPARPVA
jgi:hypothetical protein